MEKRPKYCRHKPSGKAVVHYKPLFGGNPYYLPGAFNSAESKAAYKKICVTIAAHKVAAQEPHKPPARGCTLADMLKAYYLAMETKHGRQSREYGHLKALGKCLATEHLNAKATDFGPLALKATRKNMIGRGWSRGYINEQVHRLRRAFRWSVSEELIPASVWENLRAVPSLGMRDSEARETKKVLPIEWEVVQQVFPYVPHVVRTMIELQYLTGVRSSELTGLRMSEMQMTKDIWVFRPILHKTAWRGKAKVICFGPRSQELIRPYLTTSMHAYLFSPKIAMAQKSEATAAARKSPRYGRDKNRKPVANARLNDRYDAHSYHAAIMHGFRKQVLAMTGQRRPKGVKLKAWMETNGVPYWNPHRLRHSRATETKARFGAEGAQAQLGNSLAASELYAEKSIQLAMKIARETG